MDHSEVRNILDVREIKHAHLFAGLGGGAKGFNRGKARVGNMVAKPRCLGGIDVDLGVITDFYGRTGVKGTVIDLFSREQYIAFWGKEPPRDWREATPDDIRRAFGNEVPDVLFTSPPCKGFSGLLAESKSKTAKYQALNQLTVRGIWLTLEAYKDDPVSFILLENVPRIMTRGRPLIDLIKQLLASYGYLVSETTHCCGELGGLATKRKRFLLVARHEQKVPPFLYEPEKKPLKAVGDVLGRMPLPGDATAGPMHRVPALALRTWIRLALVEAGSDWRSLNKLAIENGYVRDLALMPDNVMHRGVLGVRSWGQPAGTITGNARAMTGAFNVADPRFTASATWNHGQQYGVFHWGEPVGAVTGQQMPAQGRFAVADPRAAGDGAGDAKGWRQLGVVGWGSACGTITGQRSPLQGFNSVADPRPGGVRHNNVCRVARWDLPCPTVTAGTGPSAGGLTVADPRAAASAGAQGEDKDLGVWHVRSTDERDASTFAIAKPGVDKERHANVLRVVRWTDAGGTITADFKPTSGGGIADPRPNEASRGYSKYAVTRWTDATGTVIAGSTTGQGAFAMADPRSIGRAKGDAYLTGGHYGVLGWEQYAGAVSASACHDNGPWSVADPRIFDNLDERVVIRIVSQDGCWHRPFTTLELAAIQNLIEPEEYLELEGLSDSAWRERIGNAVPPAAAEAIADVMYQTILMAWAGDTTFRLSTTPIWVRGVAIGAQLARHLAH